MAFGCLYWEAEIGYLFSGSPNAFRKLITIVLQGCGGRTLNCIQLAYFTILACELSWIRRVKHLWPQKAFTGGMRFTWIVVGFAASGPQFPFWVFMVVFLHLLHLCIYIRMLCFFWEL